MTAVPGTPAPDLLAWLREQAEQARAIKAEYLEQGDIEDAMQWDGRADAFNQVILRVQHG